MGLLASGATDIGRKRKTNQDSIYLNVENRYFIVADGMGGHNGGDIASQMAVKVAPEYLLENIKDDPIKICEKAIKHANKKIKQHGESDELLVGMGTTMNSFFFKGPTLYVGNVGDSRSYMVNHQKLYQLSKDHSLVQEKINLGLYTREQAQADPQKNVLVRTVGFEDDVEVDVFAYKVSRYDIFLSCSDGLHGKVSDPDILHIINQHIPNPKETNQDALDKCVKALIDQANANGGNDNISVVMVVAV